MAGRTPKERPHPGHYRDEPAVCVTSLREEGPRYARYSQLPRAWQPQNGELQEAYAAIIALLGNVLKIKDGDTHAHCDMVARYASKTAAALHLDALEISVVFYAARLHDIGKIGVRDEVLNKPGLLTTEEREHMRSHVRIGYELLSLLPVLKQVATVVLCHHEWYDGSGYPDGLKSEQIPLAARIISVVDAYSAMISRRSYKAIYSEDRARTELRQCSGSQFDPYVVETFLRVLDSEKAHIVDGPEADENNLLSAMISSPIYQGSS